MLKEAVQWVKKNAIDGRCVPVSDRNRAPYPEVTGYWIPTLIQVGEHELAKNFARYLVSIQSPDGSFTLEGTDQKFVFDTGQIIRGWAAIAPVFPEVREPMRRACEWIISGANPETGKFMAPPPGNMWSLGKRGEVSEGIHMYCIQPMRDAAAILNAPHIRAAADRAMAAYITTLDLTNFEKPNCLTHFYAYIQEALFETGNRDLALAGMNSVARYQLNNGSVPAFFDVPWICAPGLIQLAKVWFLLGDTKRAEAALGFMRSLQNLTGGFYGSYGPLAEYFPMSEISWAPKYAIDAELLAIQSHFQVTVGHYAPVIAAEDGRAQAILAACAGATKILDAGCGKGRYAALVKNRWPAIEVHATDISQEMLASVPPGIHKQVASFQNMPFDSDSFDVVYCIEALEHAPNPGSALTELARLVRPGGKLVIIDKNVEKQGALEIERWESWFERDAVSGALKDLGFDCTVSELSYDGGPADGLFLCWVGSNKATVDSQRIPSPSSAAGGA